MDTYSSSPKHADGISFSGVESRASAVSWGAVLGGAAVAAALSVTMLALGTGLGLSSVSPWANAGASATSIGIAAIVWMLLMHAIASGLGGYLAGRLRTKWVDVHTDEVYFRDTAHGFLAWAVGIVVGAAFLASAAASLLGSTVETAVPAVSNVAGDAMRSASGNGNGGDRNAYFVDTLLRGTQVTGAGNAGGGSAGSDSASTRNEVARIFADGMQRQNLTPADRTYLAGVIAARTGISQPDAERRIDTVMQQAKNAEMEARQAADTARKAAAHLSLWTFVAFLVGAFCASYAATIGGRQRDRSTA